MQTILILDNGSQYTQLIARKIRECNVYCEIHPYNKIPKITEDIKGVILSGSPCSVSDEDAPQIDLSLFKGKLPLLGICYGAQYMVNVYGGKVEKSVIREYGRANLIEVNANNELMHKVKSNSQVWMSHGDTILAMPDNFEIICSTKDVKNAGYQIKGEKTYAIQFHPEVYHTECGKQILENFVINICGCDGSWTPKSFVETTITSLKEKLRDDKVVFGLSGGVDSSVAAMLLHRAIGSQLTCIFVDNGLLRKNEFENVLASYKGMGLNVIGVDAKQDFYSALAGVTEPEKKRKIIGSKFVDIFNREAGKLKDVKWLGQGTIYPDVIESSSVKGLFQNNKVASQCRWFT